MASQYALKLIIQKVLRDETVKLRELDTSLNFEKPASENSKMQSVPDIVLSLPDIVFDCRMGVYDTLAEAFKLILWRAYDCGVNGLSSAIYMSGIAGAKAIAPKYADAKLQWLHSNNLLPLNDHQAYGTLIQRVKRPVEVTNKLTGIKEIKDKWTLVQHYGNVLVNMKNGGLFYDIVRSTK